MKVQTDNTFLEDKVYLRINHLPEKQNINVLDCFAGTGKIWEKIIYIRKDKNFNVTSIDIKKYKNINYKGDNCKFLLSLDLNYYDIIDLDSYGVPYKQLEIIFEKKIKNKFVFVTFIQNIFGGIPIKLLLELNYTEDMINQCRSLFNNNGFDKFKNFLYNNGIKEIYYRNHKRIYYIFFKL